MNLEIFWKESQEVIKKHVGDTSYDTWFSALKMSETSPTVLTLEAPDDFFKNWIIDHYATFLSDLLKEKIPSASITYVVSNKVVEPDTREQLEKIERPPIEHKSNLSPLNARFTFDNFVIGSANRFACAAALAVAESPAKAYNPLFIYGNVGLGKTHLIQAITHKIRETHPHLKHAYMSSEQFTNELIDAIRNRSTPNFRKKYRDIDVLLIDDVHFIAGKEATQEEFFHTFNCLHDNKKQIIITSDRPPKEIANLEERLQSRFAWGLITDVQPPDFETRVAILRKKMERESVSVQDDIIQFIAEEVRSNIRELEGALIRVVAYAMVDDQPITLDTARIVLKDMVKESSKNITIEKVQKIVSNYYNISLSELRAKKRHKNIVMARQVAMYLSRTLSNTSLPEIGNAFGGKDHTTVMHSCKKIEKEILLDSSLKNSIEELRAILSR